MKIIKFSPLVLLLIACSPSPTESHNYCAANGWIKEDTSNIRELNDALNECIFVAEMATQELRNCKQ